VHVKQDIDSRKEQLIRLLKEADFPNLGLAAGINIAWDPPTLENWPSIWGLQRNLV